MGEGAWLRVSACPHLHPITIRTQIKAPKNQIFCAAFWGSVFYLSYLKDWRTSGLPQWLGSKESTCNGEDTGDVGSIPVLGRSPGGRHGNPLQYSCLENPVDRGAWRASVHRVVKSWKQTKGLSIHTHTHTHTHTSILGNSWSRTCLKQWNNFWGYWRVLNPFQRGPRIARFRCTHISLVCLTLWRDLFNLRNSEPQKGECAFEALSSWSVTRGASPPNSASQGIMSLNMGPEGLLPIFWFGWFVLLILNYMSCLNIWEISFLSVVSFANILSHSEGCLFI